MASWSDTFTGADGTVVAPGANWGYTNLGVQIPGWSVISRPDAADTYYLTNNSLFCYVGPCTNDPAVYNKVMAGLTPLSGGTPVWMMFTNGQIEAEIEIVDVTANAGHRWNLNQEMKLALSASPDVSDPGPYTNMYYLKVTVQPSTSTVGQVRIMPQYAFATNNINRELKTNEFFVNYPMTERIRVKYVIKSDSTWIGYTNSALWFTTNDLIAASDFSGGVFPFIWHGKFNGEGGVVADGTIVADNFSVTWIPEPGLALLGVGALALVRFRRA